MLSRALARSRSPISISRLQQISRHMATTNGSHNGTFEGVALAELPKSNVFTTNLPPDEKFPTPASSFKATRKELGPRMVKGALYTFVRPEEKEDAELYAVSPQAMRDIGLKAGEEDTEDFQKLVSGNKIMWNPETGEGIYPWAQCYGG
jgi:serine/tyrosine/threonine adenylyltransferase